LLALVPTAILLLAACGSDEDDDGSMTGHDSDTTVADGSTADRTVEIKMVDNAFEPRTVDVELGETVRFVFENTGTAAHDAFIGDAEAQAAHEEEMSEAEDMGHGAVDDEAITVDPGEEGELVHEFDQAGTIEIGCHEAGHYASGMKLDINI
jgi:uncharacterized cupredoxin-like copper-binding protein